MSSNEWKDGILDDLAEIVMGQSPTGETCNERGEGMPLLNGPTEFGSAYPTAVQFTTDPKKISQTGDLLFCVRGSTTGRMNWADAPYAIGRGLAAIRHRKGSELQPFLRAIIEYNLSTLLAEATGSTFPNVSSQQLKALKVEIPPIPVQQRIASILSSLDDKIELNRQTNTTLEAMVQALFKEWFVEFRFPGASREMVVSVAEMLPRGWSVGKLGEVCELAYGKPLKAETRIQGDYPVVGSSGVVDSHNEFLVKGPGIVIGRKGTIGEVTWLHSNFFPIDTTFYVVDKLGVDDLYYHYFLLQEQDFKKIGSDSAVPGLNRNEAYNNPVVLPSKDVVAQFNEIAKTIFDEINVLDQQTQTLTQLRDGLLPRLMKGEHIL